MLSGSIWPACAFLRKERVLADPRQTNPHELSQQRGATVAPAQPGKALLDLQRTPSGAG